MEIDATTSSKRVKKIAKDQEVVYLGLKESIDQEVHINDNLKYKHLIVGNMH